RTWQPSRSEPPNPNPRSYEELKEAVSRYRRPALNYEAWGRGASEGDLQDAARDLLIQENPSKLFYYLRIFRDRAYPGSPKDLIEIATGKNRRELAGSAALCALARMGGEQVEQFAKQQIRKGNRPGRMLELLGPSAGWDLFLELLQNTKCSHGEYHDRASYTIDRAQQQYSQEAELCLLQAYEWVPCAHCRGRISEILRAQDALPGWMAEEMKWDCSLMNRE
ncbi:unnamed protein product, partial [Phaeothamnion confervicola]